MTKPKVLLIGGGNMGRALLVGWITNDAVASVTVVDPKPSDDLKKLATAHANVDQVDGEFDVVLLAIKPQNFDDVLPGLRKFASRKTLFVSIAAGKTMTSIGSYIGAEMPVVRAMPNTPAMVGEGMTVAVANDMTSDAQKDFAQNLLGSVGTVLWTSNEDDMHAVTALSGSGPAYVFALIEAMSAAGVAQGLSTEMAAQLARQTVIGAAVLAKQTPDKTPTQLREQVTSPKGTTEAALTVLKSDDGLDKLMNAAIAAAAKRSIELA